MQHIHLNECQSTQSSFKEFWAQRTTNEQKLLVSTEQQVAGIGRRGSNWLTGKSALAMSASVPAQEVITLTPLAIGLATVEFFKQQDIKLFLKWPNDLINSQGEKVGGILCQSLEQKLVLAGIGINLFLEPSELDSLKEVPYKVGHLNISNQNKKLLAFNLYHHLLDHKHFSIQSWNKHCVHLSQEVTITDGDISSTGIFSGIDNDGAALIKNQDGIQRVITGSLRVASLL